MNVNIITHYTENSSRGTGNYYSISKFIGILDFFENIVYTTKFNLISLVLREKDVTSHSYSNTSNKMLQYLRESGSLRKVETNGLIIYIGKGVIYDSDKNILLYLTIETQYIFDLIEKGYYEPLTFSESSSKFIGYEPFVMFVSTEFANDKKFAVLYRRIKKIYLDFCFEKGIEMRLISSSKIKENTFTNSLKIKFDSLTELNRHLTEHVKYLLQTPIEYFMTQNFPLLLDTPPVTISKEKDLVQEGNGLHQQIENYLFSKDSMLEDSDLDERAFEQEIVNANLSDDFNTAIESIIDTFNREQSIWSENIPTDRMMASALAIEAINRRTIRDTVDFNTVNDGSSTDSTNIFPRDSFQQQLERYTDTARGNDWQESTGSIRVGDSGIIDWGDGDTTPII